MALFGDQFSRKPGKRQWRYVALCGAIFWTLENDSKNAKYERNQYIWHFWGINFQENPENGSGAMWRYVALFFGRWKTIKKYQI